MSSTASSCFMRIFHAYPSPLSLDIYIDETLYAKDLLYEDFNAYKGFEAQTYTFTVCPHRSSEPLIVKEVSLAPEKVYTLIICPSFTEPKAPALFLFNEPPKKIPDERFLAHTLNLSLYSQPVKLHFIDQRPEFKKLLPAHYTSYLAFQPDTYHLQLYSPDTQKTLFEQENKSFKPDRYYAFYVIGGSEAYPIKVITSIEGNSLYHFD